MALTPAEIKQHAATSYLKYSISPRGVAKRRAAQKSYRTKHRIKINARAQEKGHRRKEAVFLAYGGWVCACCGETERNFLTLGHIHGDGAEERRIFGSSNETLFRRLVRWGFPPGYRVECYNCNCGSARNGGTCPHVAH